MIVKWKVVKTEWDSNPPGGHPTTGGGEFELPEHSQLLGASAVREGASVMVIWLELSAEERIARMRATQTGRVIT